MPTKTKIEWADYVSNLLKARYSEREDGLYGKDGHACVKVSEGCTHCWASNMNVRLGTGLEYTHPNLERVTTWFSGAEEERLLKFKLPKGPFKNGRSRPILFLNDMTDMFGEWVEEQYIRNCFRIIERRPDIDFAILTKRLANAAHWLQKYISENHLQKNVIIGASVENQKRADERRAALKYISEFGFRTMVSYEPALGNIDWARGNWNFINWLICGGESGSQARPMSLVWARDARDFAYCQNIPFFFKQWGEFAPVNDLVKRGITTFKHRPINGMVKVGKGMAYHILDGVEWRSVP